MPKMRKNVLDYTASFFDLVDRYLIADLNTMILEVPDRQSGGLGYPAAHSLLSAMELMGKILSEGKVNNSKAFFFFWDDYLSKTYPEYNNPLLKKIFRNSVRNGTAHYFLVKSNIQISKGGVGHLQVFGNELRVDLKILFDHFKSIYEEIKIKVINKDQTLFPSFERGLNTLLKDINSSEKSVREYIEASNNINQPKNFDKLISGHSHSTTTVSGTRFTNPNQDYQEE